MATDRILGVLVGVAAGALLALEIAVLFAGVTARYAFHSPLVWSDELASLLFLWLAMLGAVLAFRSGDHMRMTALVARAGPRLRAFLEAFALCAALAFLLLAMLPAIDYAHDEAFITTPALAISGAWRAAALPCGLGLMAVCGALRLARMPDARRTAAAVAVTLALLAVAYALQPMIRPLGNLNLLIFFVGGIATCIFLGVPIAFAFALSTVGYLLLTTQVPVSVVIGRMDEGMSHIILLAIPLFVFLGQVIEMTGMAKAMVDFLASLVGHLRGGLHYVLIGAMYLVSGVSGSKSADMAAVAPVLFPEMIRRGAKDGDLVALLSATGAQTETVPPSIVLLTIGSVTGVSIAALFTGGLLPAVVLGAMLCLVVFWRSRGQDLGQVERASWGEALRLLVIALPAIALPVVIRSAVVEGVATATEVSTIGIAYAAIAGLLLYRKFDWRRLPSMLIYTASLSGAILLIIGAATAVSWSLTQSGFSSALARAMAALPGGGATFMAVSLVLFVVLGSVLEGIPAVVLFAPLFFPIARSLGVHEVHYAMVVVLAMGIGLFLPPFGIGYYTACAIARVDPSRGLRPIVGYTLALMVGLALVAAVPWLSVGFL